MKIKKLAKSRTFQDAYENLPWQEIKK